MLLIIPLEKILSSRDSVRKTRESHLIDKAFYDSWISWPTPPWGINVIHILSNFSVSIFRFYVISAFPFLTISIATFSIYIILWFLHNSVTSVNLIEEGWYGQPGEILLYALFSISFAAAVVFSLLVRGAFNFLAHYVSFLERSAMFATNRIFVHGFCS